MTGGGGAYGKAAFAAAWNPRKAWEGQKEQNHRNAACNHKIDCL